MSNYDELGYFRVIGYRNDMIEEVLTIPFNKGNTKDMLDKRKAEFRAAGLDIEVEQVHRPVDGWSYR